MPAAESSINPSMDKVIQSLQLILHGYKELGPQSMESLTKSYLAAPPTQDTAKDAAEMMMAEAFEIFDEATESILTKFAARVGFDLSKSPTYQMRRNEGYFRVMYPAIVMYLIWIDREGQQKTIERIGDIFASWMFGTAGYVMLDTNLDEGKEHPAEILLSLAFIQEHERLLLETFGFDDEDYTLLDRIKHLYLAAEIKEKRLRFIRSPYTKGHPEDCGYKAVHGYLPFLILLQKSGKKDQIDDYLQLFYEWGAPLQIMDDLIDLEDDLRNGHYSYPTIGFENELSTRSPDEMAKIILSDKKHIQHLHQVCKELIESSRQRSLTVGADLFGYFVDRLEGSLDSYFHSILNG